PGLGFANLMALDKAYEKLSAVHTVVRSDTFVIFDAPVLLLLEGEHRPAVFRYALLLDGATGGLEALLWGVALADQGAYKGVVGPVEWLPPNKIQDALLHVDGKEIGLFGRPSDNALAMSRVHQGKVQLPLPDDLRALAVRGRFTAAEAGEL